MDEKPTVCALCGASSIESGEVYEGYTLYTCNACAAQFWWPLKNPGANWYEHDARYADRNQDPILQPNEKHLAVLNNFGTTAGRVFDIGCGVGNFLGEAKRRGWVCAGIDFDQDAITAAQKVFDLGRLQVSDLVRYVTEHRGEQFDLVTFFDVFEHIDNHEDFIKYVRDLVRPYGYIALSVPYRHAWRWLIPHDLPPRHLTRWDDVALSAYLERNGFTVLRTWRFPASLYFLILKIRHRYGRLFSFGLVRKTRDMVVRQKTQSAAKSAHIPAQRPIIKLVFLAAKLKDVLLFGIPALVIWILILPTPWRYTDMCILARRNNG